MSSQDWWRGDGSNVDANALNIIPALTPPALDQIPLKINIGCTSRVRLWDESFRPTTTYTAPFLYTTDLLNYNALLPTIVNAIWNYVSSEQQSGAVVETHIQLWLDNVTHPAVSAGVVRLPKGSRDTQLSNEEFTSAQVLIDHLSGNILDVKNTARY